MASEDDDDRTVFGHNAPPSPRPPRQSQADPNTPKDAAPGGAFHAQATPQSPKAQTAVARGSPLSLGQSPNPVLAAATDVLILLGRLRTGRIELDAIPLRDHLTREIHAFEARAHTLGVGQDDIAVARYALVATADEIAQALPGADPAYWRQHALVVDLLNDPMAGIGFFVRLDQVLERADQRGQLLELMLTCLALGFEGKFRTQRKGGEALLRLRAKVYLVFRQGDAGPGQDLSDHWMPVLMWGTRRREKLPLWIFGSIAAGIVVTFFATLSGILSSDAQASQTALLALHDPRVQIALETTASRVQGAAYVAPVTAQLDRLRDQLKPEIDAGLVTVETKGDFVVLRLGSQVRFKSGSADLVSDFTALAQRLGRVLEAEGGAIIVEGHSDNIKMGSGGRYGSNEALSAARATTVLARLKGFVSDPERLRAVGVGPNDPLDTANTPEARQKNRRVEILLIREAHL